MARDTRWPEASPQAGCPVAGSLVQWLAARAQFSTVLAVAAVLGAVAACAPPVDENELDQKHGAVVGEAAVALRAGETLTFSGHWGEWVAAAAQVGVELMPAENAGGYGAVLVYQWDEEWLYLGVQVTDPVHANPHSWEELAQGDALAAGFWLPPQDESLTFLLALRDDGQLEVVDGSGGPLDEVGMYQVVRDNEGGTTLYELGIPWAYFDREFVIPGDVFHASVSLRRSADDGPASTLEWTPGLSLTAPDPGVWARVTLETPASLGASE